MVITVAAGKGGTGKTLVAVNLAVSLHRAGIKTLFADADVEEPNGHLFVNPTITRKEEVAIRIPRIDENLCDCCGECSSFCSYAALARTPSRVLVFEELCHGCGGCAILCPMHAIEEKERVAGVIEHGRTGEGMDFMQGILEIGEPKASPIISQMKRSLAPDAVNIVDCGPGTCCSVMTTVQGSDLCLMVTEPTPFGMHDLVMAVKMAEALGVPSVVVVNKDIAGNSEIKQFCARNGLDILLSLPFSREIARLNSSGINLVDDDKQWESEFLSLYEKATSRVGVKGGLS